ncbi:MAG: PilZ domain-containing protein [Thermodesulfobacteriota bacterium]
MAEQKPGRTAGGAPPSAAPPGRARGAASYRRLPGSQLDIPLGARLDIAPANADGAFSAEYVGRCGREFLLARFPEQPGAWEALVPAAAVTVRYLHRRYNHCGFNTRVAGVAAEPLPLLALGYPESVGALNLRRQDRADCFLPARMCCDAVEGRALVANLSETGCRLVLGPEAERPGARAGIVRGSSLACSFRLFGVLDDLFLPGLARYVQEAAGRLCLGVQFTSMHPSDRDRIRDYVGQVLAAAG